VRVADLIEASESRATSGSGYSRPGNDEGRIERVDFPKIDVDGLDLHVLRGVAGSLRAQRIRHGDAGERP
jgi:hypothetical protein